MPNITAGEIATIVGENMTTYIFGGSFTLTGIFIMLMFTIAMYKVGFDMDVIMFLMPTLAGFLSFYGYLPESIFMMVLIVSAVIVFLVGMRYLLGGRG